MKVHSSPLEGCYLFEPFSYLDVRGEFIKTFHQKDLAELGISFSLAEEFFSISQKGVLRGMHFQLPPYAHSKFVYCIQGKVHDVLLDLRKNSPTYGQSVGFELSAINRLIAFIPEGIAHGFQSLEDGSCMVYKTDTMHKPEADAGIHLKSFDYIWPISIKSELISVRDNKHPSLSDFNSPF